jgi:hypothetical protein
MAFSKHTFLFVIFFSFLTSDRASGQDTLYWQSGHKLLWQDFNAEPDSTVKQAAATYAGITYHLIANDDSFKIKIVCYFLKSKSWSKYKSNDTLLMHERLHFDIAELFARKLRQSVAEYKFNPQTVGNDIEKLYVLNKQERLKMNEIYDKETNHSQNFDKQLIWNKKISVELNAVKKYALD